MISKFVNEYIESKFIELNSYFDNSIKVNRILSDLDIEFIPANDSQINYSVYINSIQSLDYEADIMDIVNLRIEFIFNVTNKNSDYINQIFDRYIYGLRRLLKNEVATVTVSSDEDVSSSILINDIKNVNINNADNYDKDYYKPNISMDLIITDFIKTNATINNNYIV